jgi:DNA-binding transcriptional ArsR family regulator
MPVDRSRLNAVGDVVVTEPQALRALADPLSLQLFDLVRRLGPATTAQLAAEIRSEQDAVEPRLSAMAAASLIDVEASEPPRWSTPAKGIFFEIPEHGGEAQQAARELSSLMLAGAAELPKRWVDEIEPTLTVGWARAAGLFNARIDLTAEELRGLQEALERLLEPFTARTVEERPPETTRVRILSFFLPEQDTAV